MSVTFGRTSPKQFAEYDPDTSSWKTWPDIGLWGSTPFSGTWPRSGMTRSGRAFVLPMSVPRTDGSGSSSSLPTPRSSRGASGTETMYALGAERSDDDRPQGRVLLPSPRTSDTNGAGLHGDGGMDLRTAVSLMPTPRATDGTNGGPNQRGSSGDLMLPSAVMLLPTPTAQPESMGQGEARLARLQRAKDKHGRGFGLTLPAALDSIGASTDPQSDDGNG